MAHSISLARSRAAVRSVRTPDRAAASPTSRALLSTTSGSARPSSSRVGEVAQLAQRRGVERARLHRRHAEVGQPGPHLRRGPGGEGDREHMPGLDLAGQHPVGDAVRDGAGLAGAGAGEDADPAGGRGDRGPLLVVEPGEHRRGLG